MDGLVYCSNVRLSSCRKNVVVSECREVRHVEHENGCLYSIAAFCFCPLVLLSSTLSSIVIDFGLFTNEVQGLAH